jgi:glucose-1-phosphate cytidylyltransferase
MQVVILCGGKGMRMRPHTEHIPKPMMEVGEMPILEHLMRYFAKYGHTDFVLCLGYKKDAIIEYFSGKEDWNIEFVDTGEESSKAERLKKATPFIKDENFFVLYGDDLSTVNIKELEEFHMKNNALATLTAVKLVSPYGIIDIDEKSKITNFREKPVLDHYINGGFFIVNKKVLDMINDGDDFEKETLSKVAKNGKLFAFKHNGFWASMNTHQDNVMLNELWNKNEAKWKIW